MKFLSIDHCRSWLADFGLRLDEAQFLSAEHSTSAALYVVTERQNISLPEFCREVLDWLPAGRPRLLLTTGWSTHPPDQLKIFEAIRRGCGATSSVEDSPAHIFSATKTDDTDYDDRPDLDVAEESVAMWLMALMSEWTWEGYAVVQNCKDIVHLGDGFLHFESAELGRIAEARALIERWGLKPRTDFPWTTSANQQPS